MNEQSDKQDQAKWQREKRINRRSTLVSFVAIVGFILITIPFFNQVKSPVEVQDNVEKTMLVSPLTLSAFYRDRGNEIPLDLTHVDMDRDIVFSMSTIRPVHVSLVGAVDDEEPRVFFSRCEDSAGASPHPGKT